MKSLWIGGAFAVLAASLAAQTSAPAAASASPGSSPPATITPDVVALPAQPDATSTPAPTPTAENAVPFATPAPDIVDTSGAMQLALSGRDALADGLAQLAINYFQSALSKPGLDSDTRDTLNLELTTAYLALGRLNDAATALNAVQNTSLPAYALRKALLAARNQQWVEAGAQAAQLSPDQLSPDDRAWYFGLQAMLAQQANDLPAATKAWTQARDNATTEYQKSQFEVSLWRGQILLGKDATKDEALFLLSQAQQSNTDLNLASEFALQYIVMSDKLGDHATALKAAEDWIGKPGLDLLHLDKLRLEFVLIDNEDPKRPNAVYDQQVLENILTDRIDTSATGHDDLVQLQKIALSLLENAKIGGAAPLAGDVSDFQQFVNQLVDDPRGHPLMKQLRLLQAQLALSLKDYATAKTAAQAVVDLPKETGRDVVREDAWRLLAFVASQSSPPQYRVAAGYLSSLLDSLPADDPERKSLTVLMSDLYFLDGDYSDAVTGYTHLLRGSNPPTPPGAGVLLMRAVECELRSGTTQANIDAALALLDQARQRTDIDDSYTTYRWQAEFNVLSAMQSKGPAGQQAAARRLATLLDPSQGASLLPASLQLRLRWLDAFIAVQIHDPAAMQKATVLQQEIAALPPGVKGISANVRDELAASALLLCMEAASNVGDTANEDSYYNLLKKNFSDKDVNSGQNEVIAAMFTKASELALQNKTADAQVIMVDLVKQFPNSTFAPEANYQEAVYAAARNSTDSIKDAINLFEALVNTYPDSSLVYPARLKEADLMRSLSDVKSAYTIYDDLLRNHPRNEPFDPLQAKAAMGRVYCLIAMAGDDPAKRDTAMEELQRLYNLQTLPVEARVEAGWNLGFLKEHGPKPDLDDAAGTYYLVADTFLKDPVYRDQLENNLNLRYWLSECLFYLANIYEQQGKTVEARSAYQKIVENHLANEDYAKSMLESSSAAPPTPPAPPSQPAIEKTTATTPTMTPTVSAATSTPVPANTSPPAATSAPVPSTPAPVPAPAASSAAASGSAAATTSTGN